MGKGVIIALDGPVASGKGTLAPLLAKKLDGFYLQTGAMYRALALYSLRNDLDTPEQVKNSLSDINIDLKGESTFLNNEDVTEQLHNNDVSSRVPMVAAIPEVRNVLIREQKRIGYDLREKGISVIAEGRDTGTVVFPDADIKFFLDASVEIRAKRRHAQLQARGEVLSFDKVLADTIKRDESDMHQSGALVSRPDQYGYVLIESTDLTQETTLEKILDCMRQRGII